jgi:hypothetical protein
VAAGGVAVAQAVSVRAAKARTEARANIIESEG